MFEYCIRTAPSPRPHFARSQSFAHHHDRRHRYYYHTPCPENCARVSLDHWNNLCDQNKNFIETNETLTRENQTLKSDLEASAQENSRLVAHNQGLTDEIGGLRRSRSQDSEKLESFRRRVAALKLEVDQKDRDISRLQKENENMHTRVRVMTETVSEETRRNAKLDADLLTWQKRADKFQSLYEDVRSKLEKVRRLLVARTTELEERNTFIEEQRRVLRGFGALPPRRRYSFV